MNYILNKNGDPVAVPDLDQWCKWFESADRSVAMDRVGDSEISTVFLGIDHNFSGKGQPVLWETMVFGGKHDMKNDRCSGTRVDAEKMHDQMVKKVMGLP